MASDHGNFPHPHDYFLHPPKRITPHGRGDPSTFDARRARRPQRGPRRRPPRPLRRVLRRGFGYAGSADERIPRLRCVPPCTPRLRYVAQEGALPPSTCTSASDCASACAFCAGCGDSAPVRGCALLGATSGFTARTGGGVGAPPALGGLVALRTSAVGVSDSDTDEEPSSSSISSSCTAVQVACRAPPWLRVGDAPPTLGEPSRGAPLFYEKRAYPGSLQAVWPPQHRPVAGSEGLRGCLEAHGFPGLSWVGPVLVGLHVTGRLVLRRRFRG